MKTELIIVANIHTQFNVIMSAIQLMKFETRMEMYKKAYTSLSELAQIAEVKIDEVIIEHKENPMGLNKN